MSWRLDGEVLEVKVTVPNGCVAEVVLPDGRTATLDGGSHSL